MPIQDIYSNALQPIRSPDQVQAGLAQNALAMNQMRNSDMAFQTQQAQLQRDAAQRQAIAATNGDPAAIRAALVASGDAAGLEKHDAAQSLNAKNDASATESKALAGKHTLETRALGVAQLAQGMRGIDPNNDGQIVNLYAGAVKSGLLSADDAQKELAAVPPAGSPERAQWHQTQVQKGMTLAQDMQRQLEQQKLAQQAQQFGVTSSMTDRHQKAMEGLQARGQNMADARTRDATTATMTKPFEVTGADGTPQLVQMTKDGKLQPVAGYGPRLGSAKPLTEAQGKDLGFGSRMREADKILTDLAGKYSPMAINTKIGAENLPLVGGIAGPIANQGLGDAEQSAEQAQRDFVNAILRRESGAAISESEFKNARKQYFPQPGDGKLVLEQKAANRRLAIEGTLASVPETRRDSIRPQNAAPAGAPPMDAISAELERRKRAGQ